MIYTTPPAISPVPQSGKNPAAWIQRAAGKINSLLNGKMNATFTVTLTASATSTQINDSRIGATSFIGLTPQTPAAVTAAPNIHIVPAVGFATISHASNASTSQTFSGCILG